MLRQADGTESNAFRFLDIDSDLNMQMEPGRNTLALTRSITGRGCVCR